MRVPLRVGLIGAGWVTRYHLTAWGKIPDRATVVAIADPSAKNRGERASEFGIGRTYDSAAAMMDAGGIDAVDIAAPRDTHAELVRLAAERGLPILCQKPLAPTLGEAKKLVADVSGNIRLMVHENWRFRSYYRQAAAWLRAGAIGVPHAARLTVLTSGTLADQNGAYPALERQPFMRSERRMLVAEVLIHHLDTLRMLLGPLQVTSCELNQVCRDLIGEDTAIIQLAGERKLGVQVFASFAAHGYPGAATDHLEILGSEGAIRLEGSDLQLIGANPQRQNFDLTETYQGSYDATIHHFVERLADGQPFETSPDDNLQTLKLVEDCYRLSKWPA